MTETPADSSPKPATGERRRLGDYLRAEREKRGVTIEQVASATKITLKTLHHLEADEFGDLPAKPFIRGFVISYCRYIGMDPQETLQQFDPYLDDRVKDRPDREGGHSGYVFERREADLQGRTGLWVGLSVIVVLGIVGLIVKPPKGRKRHAKTEAVAVAPTGETSANPLPSAEASAVPKAEAPKGAGATQGAVAPTPTSAPEPTPSPTPVEDPLDSGRALKPSEVKHRIQVRALADVWVRYQCDTRPVHEFTLKKGRVLGLKASTTIRFQTSNPLSVDVKYNGATSQVLAQDGALRQKQDTATRFYPEQAGETVEEPFPGKAPLPTSPDPTPAADSNAPQDPSLATP